MENRRILINTSLNNYNILTKSVRIFSSIAEIINSSLDKYLATNNSGRIKHRLIITESNSKLTEDSQEQTSGGHPPLTQRSPLFLESMTRFP